MALSHHSQDSHAYLLSQFVAYPFPLAQWPFLCPFRGIIILTKIIWGGFCILYGGVDHTNPPTIKKPPHVSPIFHNLHPSCGNNNPFKILPKDLFVSFCLSLPFPFFLIVHRIARKIWLMGNLAGTMPFSLPWTLSSLVPFLGPFSHYLGFLMILGVLHTQSYPDWME